MELCKKKESDPGRNVYIHIKGTLFFCMHFLCECSVRKKLSKVLKIESIIYIITIWVLLLKKKGEREMKDTRFWLFLIFLFSGIIIGGLIGDLAKAIPYLEWLGYGKSFGLTEPLQLDISVLRLSFSIMFELNVASVIGILTAVLIYRKVKV